MRIVFAAGRAVRIMDCAAVLPPIVFFLRVWYNVGMKKKATVFIILIIIFTCAVCACARTQETPVAAELSYWMDMIKDEALITEMAIPGAHDAGTKGMVSIRETQNKDFAGMLADGARYFDVRLRLKGDGDIIFYHTYDAQLSYEEYLEDIEEFLTKHPTEFLILDYQHRDPAESAFDAILFDMLEEALGKERILCAPEGMSDIEFVNSLTLGQARGKVLVTLGADELPEGYDFVMKRDTNEEGREGSVLHSPYVSDYNKKADSQEYIEKYLDEYIDMYSQFDGGICVLQCQLTQMILENTEAKHDENMSPWIRALKTDKERLGAVNVIMRDYLNSKKCADIVALNAAKGLVKEQRSEEFSALEEKFAAYD